MTKTAIRVPGEASVRRAPRQQRAIASRSRIIAASKELLTAKGLSGFSMRAVAKLSGVGLGTIYDYFPSRSDIIHALIEERLNHRSEIFQSTLSRITSDQGLTVFVPAYLSDLVAEGFWSRYDQELRNAARADDALVRVFGWYEREIASRYVQSMIAAGSKWSHEDLMRVAKFYMGVSQQLEGVSDVDRREAALITRMVANALITNLRMVLRPYGQDMGQ